MSSRLDEARERAQDFRSRFDLRNVATQLTLAGSSAAIIIILAIIAWAVDPGAGKKTIDTTTGDTSGQTAEPGALGTAAPSGAPTTTGTGTISGGGGTAPGVGGVGGGTTAPGNVLHATKGSTIKVGLAYLKDPGTANAAAGFGGIGQVDQKRALDAMVKKINADAPRGIKVEPVYYSYTTDDVQSKGAERIYQEVCAKFSQDDRVFLAAVAGDDSLQSCFTKAKIPQIGGGDSWSQTFKQFPYYVANEDAAMDRMAEFEVDKLYSQGFFSHFKVNQAPYTPQKPADGKPRIGLIRYDQPSYKAAAAAMKKRLATHHLALCSGCEFEVAYSSDNVPEQLDDGTEVQAAITQFKQKGVTHVMFLGTTAGERITLFYIQGAENQQYRARLGFNPNDDPTTTRNFLGSSSYPQFVDSLLVAWTPRNFDQVTPQFTACKKLFEQAGETFGGDDKTHNKEAQIGGYCDLVSYFEAVIIAVPGSSLTLESWMKGVDSMKATPGVGTYTMHTEAGRHDGVGAVQLGAWSSGCNCFKPTSGVLPV